MNQAIIPIAQTVDFAQQHRRAPKGRQVQAQALETVHYLLGEHPPRRDLLIQYLHLLQDHLGCLPKNHLAALAQCLKLSQTEVFEVATFYHHFDVVDSENAISHTLTVRVCNGPSCCMAGAEDLIDKLPALLGSTVRVQAVPCIGRCEQAPAVAVGQHEMGSANHHEIMEAAFGHHSKALPPPHTCIAKYKATGGYQLLQECVDGERSVESVINTLSDSGLRGLGGAGFPAGKKWAIVRDQAAPRLMAVNIDEGEPGTFKDRTYLETNPHQFLEGMLIAAWAVQASVIYIYLRDEYHACRAMLHAELAALNTKPPIPNMPTIELRRGAGAYICGEESAMLESIEGRRGLPRLRPPYVAQAGLFKQPTLVHNFETLYWVPAILQKGAAWFKEQGRNGHSGLRSFSVSGRVNKPGVHLAPAGITLHELITEYCGGMQAGHTLYGYLPGGASGGILPAVLADVPLDFDTLQPHGCFIGSAAIVVFSQADSAVGMARNLMRFFVHESCGQCTPCRAGTAKALALIDQPQWNVPLLQELSAVMRDASICGLGQAAPNPIDCVIRYFPHEIENNARGDPA
ncbi:NADH-ubiquinone oxidoreductase-F iron-sulfur binding region domain-containing protein [Limnobacter sp.]|uniref:NADH-ubiquinone oxidoreductase-F iron-sulfur binding region domain-containing protein n=1 Tax=Limnobacter sp. TaxID=2003368 RepID=UPI002FE0AE16